MAYTLSQSRTEQSETKTTNGASIKGIIGVVQKYCELSSWTMFLRSAVSIFVTTHPMLLLTLSGAVLSRLLTDFLAREHIR